MVLEDSAKRKEGMVFGMRNGVENRWRQVVSLLWGWLVVTGLAAVLAGVFAVLGAWYVFKGAL